ncbi:MAG TPA: WhiB family transcriptional regulator [Streptosporangiaceae bacterium]|nr:WhiB family transcriptional regulator [Streptosporangiaceae bacterium]
MLSPQPTRASAAWMPRSACQGEDPEIFFPVAATVAALRQISAAKTICSRCPVRQPCLHYAVATFQEGIWGGTTTEERNGLRGPAQPYGHLPTGQPGRSAPPARAAAWLRSVSGAAAGQRETAYGLPR